MKYYLVVLFASLIICLSEIQANDQKIWSTYTNTVFGYKVSFPPFLEVSERYKSAWWKPEHGHGDPLKTGINVAFESAKASRPAFEINSRECEVLPPCSEIAGRGVMKEVRVGEITFCRAAYRDHAMGGVWGTNVEYITYSSGVCFNLMYTGLYGQYLTESGKIQHEPETGNPEPEPADPPLFAKMLRSFKFVEREE